MTKHSDRILRGLSLSLAAGLFLSACTRPAPADAPTLVNRVWKVSQSSGVEPGTLYVFLSDGTLLITSSHGTPALGRWKYGGDTLTLVEEGIPHHATVLNRAENEFTIRLRERGTPLDITFVPGSVTP